MIREVTKEDKEDVVQLIKEFFEESLEARGLKFNRKVVEKDFDFCVENESVICLVLCNDKKVYGMIAAVLCIRPFFGTKSAQELIWYISKDKRREGIKLLKEFEAQCWAEGIDNIAMICLEGTGVDRVYELLGYKKFESSYVKSLGGKKNGFRDININSSINSSGRSGNGRIVSLSSF